jgi:hypothetical protein
MSCILELDRLIAKAAKSENLDLHYHFFGLALLFLWQWRIFLQVKMPFSMISTYTMMYLRLYHDE